MIKVLIKKGFRTKRLTVPLIIVSLLVSLFVLFLFQGLIFNRIFDQSRDLLNGSFVLLGEKIEQNWIEKTNRIEKWLESEHIQHKIHGYLNPHFEDLNKETRRDGDMHAISEELNLLFNENVELEFYILDKDANVVLKAFVHGENPTSIIDDFREKGYFDEIEKSAPPRMILDSTTSKGMNAHYISPIKGLDPHDIIGLAVFSIQDHFIKNNFSELQSIEAKGEVYFVDSKGNFLTPSKNQHFLINSLGVSGIDTIGNLPILNPGAKIREKQITLDEYLQFPETKIIQEIQLKPDEPIVLDKLYKNYLGETVIGFALWIDRIQMAIVYEIPILEFLSNWFWLQGFTIILILFFVVFFLSMAIYIDKHRIYALDSNPLTHLPGNRSIKDNLKKIIKSKNDYSVVYCDLDNFKAYNDSYGFGEGDRVLKFTGDLISNIIEGYNLKYNFVGHIGGDDFMFIVPHSESEKIALEIGEKFDEGIKSYYSKEDLERGGIRAKGRTDEKQYFPVMGLSMGGINTSNHQFTHHLQLSIICSETKSLAKKQEGSVLVFDRRFS